MGMYEDPTSGKVYVVPDDEFKSGDRFVNERGRRFEYARVSPAQPDHGLFYSLWPEGESGNHGEYTGYMAMFPYEHVRAHWERV